YCGVCGAPFPWTRRPAPPAARALSNLEGLLRRLPVVIRGFRNRVSGRPGFQVSDERDLEDLLFGLLGGYSADVRPEGRTPSYASGTRTDFLLPAEGVAVLSKQVTAAVGERQLARQWPEDLAYYSSRPACRTLLGVVYDPEGRLLDPRRLEDVWSQSQGETELRCLITG
ncbi:MAG: hypothetical protein JO112_18360, partial [Planctomycetes bacterium]|nr:hypothetical protein [Planctomycetota bacterium]